MFLSSALQETQHGVPTREEIQEVTKQVLERSEFGARPWDDGIETLRETVLGWFASVGEWALETHPAVRWTLLVVLSLVLAALVAHIVYVTLKALPQRGVVRLDLSDRAGWRALEGAARNFDEALALAHASLARGDLYRTIWIAHRLMLALLEKKGLLGFAKWKTNSQYLRECKDRGQAYDLLRSLTEAYEHIIYAHRPSSRGKVETLLSQIDDFAHSTH